MLRGVLAVPVMRPNVDGVVTVIAGVAHHNMVHHVGELEAEVGAHTFRKVMTLL